MSEQPRQDRLGWFVPFMQAYGQADASTRQQLAVSAQSYEAHLITAYTLIERVDSLLGLEIPA